MSELAFFFKNQTFGMQVDDMKTIIYISNLVKFDLTQGQIFDFTKSISYLD